LDGGPAGGVYNPVNLNLYHYGANNPIIYKDPNGLVNLRADVNQLMSDIKTDTSSKPYTLRYNSSERYSHQKKWFSEIVDMFSGYTYGGDGGNGFNNSWNNPSNGLVCTSFAESVLRLATNLGASVSDKNKGNAVAIFMAFGLKGVGTFKPSQLRNLDKSKIYAIGIFKKNFKSGTWSNDATRFDKQSWFNEDQHVVKDGDNEYGTNHVGFLMYKDDKWQIMHQHNGDNIQDWDTSAYNNDNTYRMKVFKVYND
jgi:hypothetical protein